MPSKNELQLEFIKLLENDRLAKLKQLKAELEHIERLKQNNQAFPKVGQKRRSSFIENQTEIHGKFAPLIDKFSIQSPWDDIAGELEAVSKTYTLSHVACVVPSAGSSQIISSVEPDFQKLIFAAGGVSKQIRFFDCNSFELLREVETDSKISCLGWSRSDNSTLYCSDYKGALSQFDTSSGQLKHSWLEHEKRIWSLDTCPTDPMRIMTGSDDCCVKIWSEKCRKSILNINVRANVCSVRFHPTNSNIVAAAGADHRAFIFDLRKTNRPLSNEKDHKKSVSYVRFTEEGKLVTAGTDNSLRLWSTENFKLKPIRSYSGHCNEKNFVGLSIQDDLFAVGSEDNSVYLYQKYISEPVECFSIPNTCPLTGQELPHESGCFVSSVSWLNDSRLLVANSLGSIHVLTIK